MTMITVGMPGGDRSRRPVRVSSVPRDADTKQEICMRHDTTNPNQLEMPYTL